MIHWSVVPKHPDDIGVQDTLKSWRRLMNLMAELESVLEILCNHVYSSGRLCTNFWATSNCTNLPPAHTGFPLRPSRCCTVHRNHYPSLRIQQLLVAGVPGKRLN